jgi:hypothetical protein
MAGRGRSSRGGGSPFTGSITLLMELIVVVIILIILLACLGAVIVNMGAGGNLPEPIVKVSVDIYHLFMG